MADKINFSELRARGGKDVVSYLRQFLSASTAQAITQHLLKGLEQESITSHPVIIWLDASKDDSTLIDCLYQPISRILRRAAIKRFVRRLKSRNLEATWSMIGKEEGVAKFMSKVSVQEIKLFCHSIGGLATKQAQIDAIRTKVTALLKLLASDVLPDTKAVNIDSRPLYKYYALMLPACEPELVQQWLDTPKLSSPDYQLLLDAHPSLCKRRMVNDVQTSQTYLPDSVNAMLDQVPRCAPESHGETAGLTPAMTMMFEIIKEAPAARLTDESVKRLVLTFFKRTPRSRSHYDAAHLAQRWDALLGIIEASPLKLSGGDCQHIVERFLRTWSRHSEQLTPPLIRLLARMDNCNDHVVAMWLERVPQSRRVQFLKIVLKHVPRYKTDLDDHKSIKSSSFAFNASTFILLPTAYSLQLLDTVVTVREENAERVAIDGMVHTTGHSSLFVGHCASLRLYLSRGKPGLEQEALQLITDAQRKAERERMQEVRERYATDTLRLAIASGSLELAHKVYFWFRRFNKDPETLAALYQRSKTGDNQDVKEVLTGCNQWQLDQQNLVSSLKSSVMQANAIIESMFEAACMAVNEPSFLPFDWAGVFALFKEVVMFRRLAIVKLQKHYTLTDDDLFSAIWEPTIETAMTLEESLLKESMSPLTKAYKIINGPLFDSPSSRLYFERHGEYPLDKATLRFLDTLARRRDEFWKAKRLREHPDIALLPSIWPRGLPAQCVASFMNDHFFASEGLPYITERAESVVFFDAEAAAKPIDDDQRPIISSFIDSYRWALRFWVEGVREGDEREARALKAWKHAVRSSPAERLTHEEARRFWTVQFGQILDRLPKSLRLITKTTLNAPPTDDVSDPSEWNPQPDITIANAKAVDSAVTTKHAKHKTVDYDEIALDALFDYQGYSSEPVVVDSFPIYIRPDEERSVLFGNREIPSDDPEMLYTMITAAMLFIASEHKAGTKLLSSPFPSIEDARFPAVYLDQDFLDVKHSEFHALQCLRNNVDKIPTKLSHRLLDLMLAEREDKKAVVQTNYLSTFKALLNWDRPSALLDLIAELVVHGAEDSSWHRHFLGRGLLIRLSSEEAASFMSNVMSRMIGKLEEAKAKANSNKEDANPSALIKISTLRIMAQLLTNSDFVSQAQSIKILRDLFDATPHTDIRISILDSLVLIAEQTNRAETEQEILEMFIEAGKAAAEIDERYHMTEEKWQKAEETKIVPSVLLVSNLPPLLDRLCKATDRIRAAGKNELADAFVSRLLMPILHRSVENNRRWTRIFLIAHDFPLSIMDELPDCPVHPHYLIKLMWQRGDVPRLVAEMIFQYFKAHLNKSEEWQKVDRTVRENGKLRTSEAGRNWEAVYGRPITWMLACEFNLRQNFDFILLSDNKRGASPAEYHDFYWWQAKWLIDHGSEYSTHTRSFLNTFRVPADDIEYKQRNWIEHQKPLLERIIHYVDGVRTSQWQTNKDRSPDVLPDLTESRLKLLPYPELDSSLTQEARQHTFVEAYLAGLEKLAANPISCLVHASTYERALETLTIKFAMPIAVELGSVGPIERDPTFFLWLRIRSANSILVHRITRDRPSAKQILTEQPQLNQTVERMLTAWDATPVEEIRNLGKETFAKLRELMM